MALDYYAWPIWLVRLFEAGGFDLEGDSILYAAYCAKNIFEESIAVSVSRDTL